MLPARRPDPLAGDALDRPVVVTGSLQSHHRIGAALDSSIDLHLPDPLYDKGFEGDEFISKAYYTHFEKPYWIPYRCLYSRNIRNLFMAGRDISVTHEALGAVRVMRTCGMMGELVGMAASLCKKYNTDPRGVFQDHLGGLKQIAKSGVGKLD